MADNSVCIRRLHTENGVYQLIILHEIDSPCLQDPLLSHADGAKDGYIPACAYCQAIATVIEVSLEAALQRHLCS